MAPNKITIGKFDLEMSEDGLYLQIRLNSGGSQGEMGTFDIDHRLEKVIEDFYIEHF